MMRTGYLHFGSHTMALPIARTEAERAQGLRGQPAGHGMLFDFVRPSRPTMTMSGLPYPLDMVFIDERGLIVMALRAEAEAPSVPSPPTPVLWVAELPVGKAPRLGLVPGRVVRVTG